MAVINVYWILGFPVKNRKYSIKRDSIQSMENFIMKPTLKDSQTFNIGVAVVRHVWSLVIAVQIIKQHVQKCIQAFQVTDWKKIQINIISCF